MLQLTPRAVFTPGSAFVNEDMYIKRTVLEDQVKKCLNGHKHFIIHGESGNGKTWLWKRVFDRNKITHISLNLARAVALGSVRSALEEKLRRDNPEQTSEIRYEGGAQLKPGGIGVDAKKSKTVKVVADDPFIHILAKIKGIPSKHSIVVFENFDQIASDEQMVKELASYLMLLDDDDYAKYYARICIVGVPSNLKEFFSVLPFAETVSRRRQEVEEVARMSQSEARDLLRRGFSALRLVFSSPTVEEQVYERLLWVSDRNAEQLQQLGLDLSLAARENSSVVDFQVLNDVVSDWVMSLRDFACTRVESLMSHADTRYGRGNQMLYCIGAIESHEFSISDLKRVLHEKFNSHSDWIARDFTEVFERFTGGFNPILGEGAQPAMFRLKKDVYRMAIRSLLRIDEVGGVHKITKAL